MKKAAFIVTYIGLLLPYRLRIIYGFLLNFTLAPLNAIKQLLGMVNLAISFILFFLVYYLAIPVTKLLRQRRRLVLEPLNQRIGRQDIFRMF